MLPFRVRSSSRILFKDSRESEPVVSELRKQLYIPVSRSEEGSQGRSERFYCSRSSSERSEDP